MLRHTISNSGNQHLGLREYTSFLVTGFSSRLKCVNLGNVLSGSRSASSAKLFAVRTRVVRFGSEVARVG